MTKLTKHAEYFMMAELMKAKQEVSQKESGREGVDFIVKTKTGNYHELFLQTLELDKQRSIKIPKQQLGELKDNLWIVLILFHFCPVKFIFWAMVHKSHGSYFFSTAKKSMQKKPPLQIIS